MYMHRYRTLCKLTQSTAEEKGVDKVWTPLTFGGLCTTFTSCYNLANGNLLLSNLGKDVDTYADINELHSKAPCSGRCYKAAAVGLLQACFKHTQTSLEIGHPW